MSRRCTGACRLSAALLALLPAGCRRRAEELPVEKAHAPEKRLTPSGPESRVAGCVRRIHRRLVALADVHPQLSKITDAEVTASGLVYQKGSRERLPRPPRPPGERETKHCPYKYSEQNACLIGVGIRHPVFPSPLRRCSDRGHYYEKAKLKLGLQLWFHGRGSEKAEAAVYRAVREEVDKLAEALEAD